MFQAVLQGRYVGIIPGTFLEISELTRALRPSEAGFELMLGRQTLFLDGCPRRREVERSLDLQFLETIG